jgi:hypothetical protein
MDSDFFEPFTVAKLFSELWKYGYEPRIKVKTSIYKY